MPNIAPLWVDHHATADQVAGAVDTSVDLSRHSPLFIPDSRRAWIRLAVAVLIGALGSVGMWSIVVALPAVQAEFGVTRGTASLAFTLVMLGFGSGGVLTGKSPTATASSPPSASVSAFSVSVMSAPASHRRSGNSSWCIS